MQWGGGKCRQNMEISPARQGAEWGMSERVRKGMIAADAVPVFCELLVNSFCLYPLPGKPDQIALFAAEIHPD